MRPGATRVCSVENAPAKTSPKRRFVGLTKRICAAPQIPRGEVQMFPFRGGYCGLVGIEDGLTNACLLASYERARGHKPAAIWQSLRAENRALGRATRSAVPVFEWMADGQRFVREPGAHARRDFVRGRRGGLHSSSQRATAWRWRFAVANWAAATLGAALRGDLKRADVAPLYQASWHREFGRRLAWGGPVATAFCGARPHACGAGLAGFRARIGGARDAGDARVLGKTRLATNGVRLTSLGRGGRLAEPRQLHFQSIFAPELLQIGSPPAARRMNRGP